MSPSDRDKFVQRAEAVLGRIEVYCELHRRDISAEDLETAKRHIKMMIAVVRREVPVPSARYKVLTRIIADQWPLGHELGKAIAELETAYVGMAD